MDLRQVSKTRLESDPSLTIGDVTSINLTMISGGIQDNIVPEKMTAHFDIRLATSENLEAFENTANKAMVCGSRCPSSGIKIVVRTFPGGTDSRFIRATGTPALGLTPAHLTPSSLHEHDENLPVVQFLRGIEIYEEILPAVANI
ncbi:Aminoacylase-1 [Papilio machaon]|uniref:Aminoacylase-1 n=1 Tax=Papilio machaon TaxID=76193 RepID=A0A0N1PIX5_PAPMA|nr:Aminoacylase-1 [Papilio machaon]